eukprot:m.378280 g.378280  ORF g.378280 m.378280 type:complete len:673 (+) comp20929_c0_seq1:197-2215(+)
MQVIVLCVVDKLELPPMICAEATHFANQCQCLLAWGHSMFWQKNIFTTRGISVAIGGMSANFLEKEKGMSHSHESGSANGIAEAPEVFPVNFVRAEGQTPATLGTSILSQSSTTTFNVPQFLGSHHQISPSLGSINIPARYGSELHTHANLATGSTTLSTNAVARPPSNDGLRSLSDHDAYKFQRSLRDPYDGNKKVTLFEEFDNLSFGNLRTEPQLPRQTAGTVTSTTATNSAIPDGSLAGAESTDPAPVSGKLFVGGLSWETTEEGLVQYFGQFGAVSECQVMCDPNHGRSRGFGFVTFVDPAVAAEVSQKGPHTLDNRTIDPKPAVPRGKAPKRGSVSVTEGTRGNKIFVGGLSPDTTTASLAQFFSHFGTVQDVVLMYDRDTKRPRGFGFVTFTSDQPIGALCALQFADINGKRVEIKVAEPKPARASEPPRARGSSGRGTKVVGYSQQQHDALQRYLSSNIHPGAGGESFVGRPGGGFSSPGYPSAAYAGPFIVTHPRGGSFGPPSGSPVPHVFDNFSVMGGGGQHAYMQGPAMGHYAMGPPPDDAVSNYMLHPLAPRHHGSFDGSVHVGGGGGPVGLPYAFTPTSPFVPGGSDRAHVAPHTPQAYGLPQNMGNIDVPGVPKSEAAPVPVPPYQSGFVPTHEGISTSSGIPTAKHQDIGNLTHTQEQ